MRDSQAMHNGRPTTESRGHGLCAKSAIALVLVLAVALGGCSIFRNSGQKSKDKNKIQGERISVLSFEGRLAADPRIADVDVRLPKPYDNQNWAQAGGDVSHVMQHLDLAPAPKVLWRASVGKGSGGVERLIASPVVADGKVFTLDANNTIAARRDNDGRLLWSLTLKQKGEKREAGIGGGIAYSDNVIYATSGFGFVTAIDADSGKEIWRNATATPMRGAPTIADGRVFAVSYDNQLFALTATNGDVIWSHVGIAENAGVIGTASPAVVGDTVVAAFSSGEIYALRVENGQVIWSDTLSRTTVGLPTPMSSLNDVDGLPVVDRGEVYAISQGGSMVAINLRTGERVWERNIGGTQTPWVAGDFIYLLTSDDEVLCLSRRDGRIRWVRELPDYIDPEKRKKFVYWSGPVLAGDRLIVVSSLGYAVSISPYDGRLMSKIELPDQSFISPIVAGGTLYILSNDAVLLALK
jgi:outer membrane protein assembly factor BamB